jgi:hypothetical protein
MLIIFAAMPREIMQAMNNMSAVPAAVNGDVFSCEYLSKDTLKEQTLRG